MEKEGKYRRQKEKRGEEKNRRRKGKGGETNSKRDSNPAPTTCMHTWEVICLPTTPPPKAILFVPTVQISIFMT